MEAPMVTVDPAGEASGVDDGRCSYHVSGGGKIKKGLVRVDHILIFIISRLCLRAAFNDRFVF